MKEKKEKKIDVYCTADQDSKIAEKAQVYHMSKSEFLLFCGMGALIDIRIGVDPAPVKIDSLVSYLDRGLIDEAEFMELKKKVLGGEMVVAKYKEIERGL